MNDPSPVSILASALEHLAHFFRTGKALSAHRAAVLFERIAGDAEADIHVREYGGQLAEALGRRLAVFPRPAALIGARWYGDSGEK